MNLNQSYRGAPILYGKPVLVVQTLGILKMTISDNYLMFDYQINVLPLAIAELSMAHGLMTSKDKVKSEETSHQ